ncbi:MAG: glycerol-3-phosphate dehydrogenase/oxidase [Spirochaetes bacterium]|nr:glycerol-3-phosphate dehydrogenase/oxidase [Spirochaetota bacterium]
MLRFIDSYDGREFDIIIIGGGITGAAVAYDAASRGYTVALLEKDDFGGATSAATSKLIHGGLRYLNYLEFGLVRESLRERRILENIAPNLVNPMSFMIPNYDTLMTNKWLIKLGMMLYDVLSFDKTWTWDKIKQLPLHRTISKKDVLELEPKVRSEKLTGASIYYDCQSIFPERLTLAFIKSAVKYGASVANYAYVHGFLYRDGKRISGVKVRDKIHNRELEIKSGLVVNCCGTWADIVLNIAEKGESTNRIKRSEGIHLIIDKIANKHAVLLRTGKGRHFFILPWRNHSLIGTTDREYNGEPDNYRVKRKSIEEFIAEINESYGDGKLKYSDIKHTYGGLRPIVDDQTEGTYESSRKYEIYDNAKEGYEGLITVEGGKYTTSRNLASKVMKLIEKKTGREPGVSVTDRIYLAGCEVPDLKAFLDDIKNVNRDFDVKTLDFLGRNYGTESRDVLKIARSRKDLAVPINDDGEILAEVVYAAREEMALKLTDILLRRTGLGTLGHPGKDALKKIADTAAKELGWSAARKKSEIKEAEERLNLPE